MMIKKKWFIATMLSIVVGSSNTIKLISKYQPTVNFVRTLGWLFTAQSLLRCKSS